VTAPRRPGPRGLRLDRGAAARWDAVRTSSGDRRASTDAGWRTGRRPRRLGDLRLRRRRRPDLRPPGERRRLRPLRRPVAGPRRPAAMATKRPAPMAVDDRRWPGIGRRVLLGAERRHRRRRTGHRRPRWSAL